MTLGDFKVKKRKIGKGNLYLSENRLSWNEMCCAADNHNYMCHTCAKEVLDSNFNEAVVDKISIFQEITTNSTYSHKSYFFKHVCNFLDQLLHPYKFHGRDMSGILFFIFASCEPLKCNLNKLWHKLYGFFNSNQSISDRKLCFNTIVLNIFTNFVCKFCLPISWIIYLQNDQTVRD